MTKQEIVSLFHSLNQLGTLKGVKFAYGVSKNIALVKPEIESLEKASAPTDEFKKFDEERVEMVKKFAKKDDKGEFIIKGSEYEIEDKDGMDKAFEELKEKNKEVFEARQKQVKEYNDLLKTESAVTLYKISLSDVPADISVQQMYSISAIVDEATPSPYKP